jgi:hypothetical protein
MELDKFRSLSLEKRKEILEEYTKITDKLANSMAKRPNTPPPSSLMAVKRELGFPNTPHKGGSKKVVYISLVC